MSTYSLYELYDYRKEGKLNLKDNKVLNAIVSSDRKPCVEKGFNGFVRNLAGEAHNLTAKNFSNLHSITKVAVVGHVPSILLNFFTI